MVAVLSGEGTDTVNVTGDTVSVNLAAVIDVVKKRLVDAGFTLANRIPTVNAQFTIFQSADLAKAQTVYRLLDSLARWLPVLALLLLALAVYVARRRRQTLIWSAVAVAASMLVLGAALNIFRPVYLDAIDPRVLPTPPQPRSTTSWSGSSGSTSARSWWSRWRSRREPGSPAPPVRRRAGRCPTAWGGCGAGPSTPGWTPARSGSRSTAGGPRCAA